jgi:hypothetical protein
VDRKLNPENENPHVPTYQKAILPQPPNKAQNGGHATGTTNAPGQWLFDAVKPSKPPPFLQIFFVFWPFFKKIKK